LGVRAHPLARVGDSSWTQLSGLVPDFSFLLGWRSPLLIGPQGHLYAGTAGAGVFRSSAPLGIPSDTDFSLGTGKWRVFPNPFCDRTTFAFALAGTERVTLSVYDLGGRTSRTATENVVG
jgi:hypothetical protein